MNMVPGRPNESPYSSTTDHTYTRLLCLPPSAHNLTLTIVGNITPLSCIPVDHTFGIGKLSEVEKSSLFQPPDLGNQGSRAKEVIHISATCLVSCQPNCKAPKELRLRAGHP